MQNLKIKNLNFLLITFHLLLATSFFGCATYPRRKETKEAVFLTEKTFRLGRTDYVYLRDLCRVYDLAWEWDVLGERLTLYREGLKVSLALGSSFALLNEQIIDLKDKLRIHNNEIAVPFSLSLEMAKIIFPPPRVISGIYKIRRVVIDPGHGGRDPGAIGPGGIKEKDVVLEIAKRLKNFLENMGIEVILTRERDRFVSLWRRTHLANTKRADLFISIHANSSRYRQASGLEIYYLSDRMDESSKALARLENAVLEFEEGQFFTENTALAATLWDIVQTQNRAQALRLAKHIEDCVGMMEDLDKRGVKGANFYVLRGANMPAILIETGFISNLMESRRLADPAYSQKLAEAIGRGILAYKEEYEKTDGFTR
ncbi:MAG: N-acetylmuramoyl-L-alanine amidase [Candidatus Omnitrophica bacterium]|nr:N-acetylmuramoyl-L-alanine amidase [Candidatus Omnitrophota bacterium]